MSGAPLDYLAEGLLAPGGLRPGLAEHARPLARGWVSAGLEPAALELLGETLARWADELGDATIDATTLRDATDWLGLPEPVLEFLSKAVSTPLDAASLAALAVHVVDLAEMAALEIFVAELPALSARSDRSGAAARRVGTARHLKG